MAATCLSQRPLARCSTSTWPKLSCSVGLWLATPLLQAQASPNRVQCRPPRSGQALLPSHGLSPLAFASERTCSRLLTAVRSLLTLLDCRQWALWMASYVIISTVYRCLPDYVRAGKVAAAACAPSLGDQPDLGAPDPSHPRLLFSRSKKGLGRSSPTFAATTRPSPLPLSSAFG